ncbi:protein MAINTENANCE OF MERISTEMS-like [Lathyrus oleraceus]|uniref:protein MAINTENANCE OF MERISTEMS-like n=1 Tax=Pisum sativum TaxID=3888 RepID=UPI0021CE6F55|nr:protein MAINTENANCE OF MERISTEMS-like [Pisum sativum]
MTKDEALEMMVEYLGANSGEAMKELDKTRGVHARFVYLKKVVLHKSHALRAYMLYLVGTVIFVDKSVTYIDVIYLCYLVDFERIHEYNRGAAYLVYLYLKLREGCMRKTKQVTGSVTLMMHFPRISGWASVPDYIEDMPCATTFIPLRGNQETEPYIVYLDHLVAEDMHLNNYVDHREKRPFKEIVIYSGWIACGSRLTALHLPERIMRQFYYTQTIPRHPVVSAPSALTRRQIEDMFDDYESHLVPKEERASIAESDWS